MTQLSWNIRFVLVLVALALLASLGFGVYYTVIRLDRGKALEFEAYPSAQLIQEETVAEGYDHFYYTSTDPAEKVEAFYREQGYNCTRQVATIYENGIENKGAYAQSVCIVDRSHSLGFVQFNTITIQPQRTPYERPANDPQGAIIGGGTLTGVVIIDIQRQWGGGFLEG